MKRRAKAITDKEKAAERSVIRAVLIESKCQCLEFDCRHMWSIWVAAERLSAIRQQKRGGRE